MRSERTTLDVLNAQLELVTAQIMLMTARRDRIVAEYSLYAATRLPALWTRKLSGCVSAITIPSSATISSRTNGLDYVPRASCARGIEPRVSSSSTAERRRGKITWPARAARPLTGRSGTTR